MAQPDSATQKNPNEAQDLPIEEEIPAYTVIPLTNNKIKELNIVKYAAKKVIKLFVTHLLDTEMVKIHDKLEKHFVMRDITFRNVMIRGVVIALQFLKFKVKERTVISVDDGTGVIDCYIEYNSFLENTRTEVQSQVENTTEMFEMVSSNTVLKAALMMLQSAKERVNKLPHYKNFRIGDTVELIGTISEYNGKRSCFVSSVLRTDSSGSTRYLENLHELYETAYFR